MTKRRRHPVGIRPWKGGWQAYVQVDGRSFFKSFPQDTPVDDMKKWREDTRADEGGIAPGAGTFAADVDEYLSRVKAMPTFNQRATHLELWLDALGRDRSRRSITSSEIDAVLQQWAMTPTNQPNGTPGRRGRPSAPDGLEPGTIRKRRTALLSLFVKLDGKTAANPVRGTTNPREPEAEARGTDYATIARILAAMPTYRSTKPGTPRTWNLAKIRAAVMAYTGIPPATLKKITRNDLNLTAKTVRLQRRRKGQGAAARTVALNDHAVEAFRLFVKANAFGPFAEGSVNVSFKRACRSIGVSGLHLYDLRHSFGAELYRQTGDESTVGRSLGHAPHSKVTHRYTKAAHQDVDAAAAEKMSAAITHGRNLSAKLVRRRKAKGRKHFEKAS